MFLEMQKDVFDKKFGFLHAYFFFQQQNIHLDQYNCFECCIFWPAHTPKTQFQGIWPNGHFTMVFRAAKKAEVHFLTVLKELIGPPNCKIRKIQKGK
jgi:hypothetical protein